MDQGALLFVDLTLFLCRPDDREDFFIRHRIVILRLEDLQQQLLPQAEQPGERCEDHHKELQRTGYQHGKRIRRADRQRLRCDLTEKQEHDRNDDRSDRRTAVAAPPAHTDHCRHGGGGDVDDVIADEDR